MKYKYFLWSIKKSKKEQCAQKWERINSKLVQNGQCFNDNSRNHKQKET